MDERLISGTYQNMPTQIAKVFRSVKAIFLSEENHNPLFMWSQNMPVNPKVNQLPKRAVYNMSALN
jgi:hypothetical protein